MTSQGNIKFLADEGIILYNNRRISICDIETYHLLFRDLVASMGSKKAQEMITRVGYSAGYFDAMKMRDEFNNDDGDVPFEYVSYAVKGRGIAKLRFIELKIDKDKGDFYVKIEAKNSFESEQNIFRFETKSSNVNCNFLSGYISGFASMNMGREIYFFENQCRLNGDLSCILEGKPIQEWNEDIKSNAGFLFSKNQLWNHTHIPAHSSEEKYYDLYENAPVIYCSLNRDGIITECNNTACKKLGYNRKEMIGQHISNFFTNYNEEKFWSTSDLKSGFKHMEGIFITKDNNKLHMSFDATVCLDVFGEIEEMRCTLIDISKRKLLETKLKEKNKMLEQMNKIDALTTVYNRRYLMEIFEAEFEKADRYGYPLSLVILDLDRFKQVNDYFGHQAGDKILKIIADLLKNSVRKGDLVARFGGEEFIILAPCTELRGAYELSNKVRSVIEKDGGIEIEKDVTIHVTASFGVATYFNANYLGLNSFLQAADDALLKSKRSGRNKVTIDETKSIS